MPLRDVPGADSRVGCGGLGHWHRSPADPNCAMVLAWWKGLRSERDRDEDDRRGNGRLRHEL